MWHCPAAQKLWTVFREAWSRLGLKAEVSDPAFCSAIFSLRLPRTPPAVWAYLGPRGIPTDVVPVVHDLLAAVWRQQILGCFQQIWRWRHGVNDAPAPWSATVATAALRISMSVAYSQVRGHHGGAATSDHIVNHILHGAQRLQSGAPRAQPRPAPASMDQYLLFFDGGSRDNPGPGGAGAVVVRVDAYGLNPHILWAAAMSLAHATTTNNQAEYFGLLTGLRFASKRHLSPLTVIGDSAMILQQLRTYKAPKHPTLRQLYGQARILADTLQVAAWCHHLRAYNKMADSAANIAMDTRQSRQTLFPTQQAHWAPLATHLHGDVEQWQVSTPTGHAEAS